MNVNDIASFKFHFATIVKKWKIDFNDPDKQFKRHTIHTHSLYSAGILLYCWRIEIFKRLL